MEAVALEVCSGTGAINRKRVAEAEGEIDKFWLGVGAAYVH